jgi:hypothetical protein
MKGTISFLASIGFVVVVCLLALPVFTQDQELKAQGYLMTEYVVKPFMAKEFEKATIEEKAMFADVNFPYGWNAYSTEDFHYYFFTPTGKDVASLDRFNAALTEAETRLPENYETLEKRMAGAYEYYREMVVYLRPDLSYTPAESNIKPEESNYVFFELTYILPEKEKEFEAYYKEWAVLCQKIGFRIGYVAYKGVFGTDNPFYVSTMISRTQADTFVEEERIMKTMSPEEQVELGAAYEKAFSYFRKYETKNSRSRPDLSNTPKAK